MSHQATPRPIIVLGAGIIGLTTAVRLLESSLHTVHHHPIHIIADHWPDDPLQARYASTAAGAHHLSFAADDDYRQQRWDRRTFEVMCSELEKLGKESGLMKIRQTEYYDGTEKHLKILEAHPDFVIHPAEGLPPFATHSVSFTSITMNPLPCLLRLLEKIKSLQSISPSTPYLHKHHLDNLTDIVSPDIQSLLGGTSNNPIIPLAIIPCLGLGSSTIKGINDNTVYPTRGQVILLKSLVKDGYTRQIGSLSGKEGGQRTYVIPRNDGTVILGGTREDHSYISEADDETITSILKRTAEICPDLLGGSEVDQGIEEMRRGIIGHIVGFRPSRLDGVRLERGDDLLYSGEVGGEGQVEDERERTVVVHNYGHGGAGWQSCWGCAEDVVKVLSGALTVKAML